MSEQERLFAQYEDAFFALLMNEVAEAEGQELLKKNEQLLADPIVQGILGHASIETTRKYLHKNEDIEREAIATMSNYIILTK